MDKRRLLWLFNAGERLVYLLRDEFTTDDDAPITSPRTCEPGPGTLTVTDTGNNLSVSSGSLRFGGLAATGNPGVVSVESFTPSNGLSLLFNLSVGNNGRYYVGFSTSNGATYRHIYRTLSNLWNARESFDTGLSTSLTDGAIICRSTGAFYVIGGKLDYVDSTFVSNVSPVYAVLKISNVFGGTTTSGYLRVAILSAPWDTDYGIATNRVASPAVNETTTSEANGLIEQTWTAVTGETWELSTRRTDDDNRWIVRCDQAGSTVKLIERNAGVETERSSAAQTWTNGTQYRLVVIQDGDAIRTYVSNVAKNSYTSASFNNTATGVETNKAGSNLVTYPRTLSGAALAELQRWTS